MASGHKKSFFLLGFAAALLLLAPLPAVAHFEERDGTVTATLHLDPDDDPIVGQPTTVSWNIETSHGDFDFADCNCVFSVSENGRGLPWQDLGQGKFLVTFPEQGTYHITLSGQNFNAAYDFRVQRLGAGAAGRWRVPSHFWHGIFFLVPFLIFFSLAFRDWLRNKRKEKAKRKSKLGAAGAAVLLSLLVGVPHVHAAACHAPNAPALCCVTPELIKKGKK